MNLEIEYNDLDKDEIYNFCNWLIPRIQEYLYANIDDEKLARFDAYLNSNNTNRWQIIPQIVRTKNILIGAVYNLIVKSYGNYFDIQIDPNINIPNSFAKFIDIVSLVDKGNLLLAPYAIFSDTMNYFADNINIYFKEFIEGEDVN